MTESSKPILNKVYRVVDILSPSRVVLNCGSRDGIEYDFLFEIYAYGNQIKDPETKEDLGKVYLQRGTGKVRFIQEKLCTVESETQLQGITWILTVDKKTAPFDDVRIGDLAKLLSRKKAPVPPVAIEE